MDSNTRLASETSNVAAAIAAPPTIGNERGADANNADGAVDDAPKAGGHAVAVEQRGAPGEGGLLAVEDREGGGAAQGSGEREEQEREEGDKQGESYNNVTEREPPPASTTRSPRDDSDNQADQEKPSPTIVALTLAAASTSEVQDSEPEPGPETEHAAVVAEGADSEAGGEKRHHQHDEGKDQQAKDSVLAVAAVAAAAGTAATSKKGDLVYSVDTAVARTQQQPEVSPLRSADDDFTTKSDATITTTPGEEKSEGRVEEPPRCLPDPVEKTATAPSAGKAAGNLNASNPDAAPPPPPHPHSDASRAPESGEGSVSLPPPRSLEGCQGAGTDFAQPE